MFQKTPPLDRGWRLASPSDPEPAMRVSSFFCDSFLHEELNEQKEQSDTKGKYMPLKIIVNPAKKIYDVRNMMIIIVGLGNPGAKFNNTPHNVGFEILDFFAQKNGFPEFTLSKKYESMICEHDGITLAKPQSFMNDSGAAVKKIMSNTNDQMLMVVHDDIDLPLGKIKFSKDSGAGGHKGVESIIQHLGNNHFIRLKIGIGSEDQKIKALEVVLKKFTKAKQEMVKDVIEKSAQGIHYVIENGLEKTMNEYN